MRPLVNGWPERVHGLIWPPTCVVCGGRGQPPAFDLCAGCESDLPLNQECCDRCALPIAGTVCGACLLRPPHFDRALVPYRYDFPIDRLIQAHKYGAALEMGRVLGTLLARAVSRRTSATLPALLIPVPLHPARQRERGFNQATEVARQLRRQLGIAIDPGACVRTRATHDQTQLSARLRRHNMAGAFALRCPLSASHVALVDDVMTTGSTAGELARVLKLAGVQTVEVWSIARAAPQRRHLRQTDS